MKERRSLMTMLVDASLEPSISHVEALYEVRDPEVRPVLAANPDLISLLEKIIEVVPDNFGADARLALEVLHDPEGGPELELFAVVQTPSETIHALDRLRAFDEGWWFGQVSKVAGRLTVTLE
jgi:hypothetical protein